MDPELLALFAPELTKLLSALVDADKESRQKKANVAFTKILVKANGRAMSTLRAERRKLLDG